MKIDKVELRLVRMPLVEPFETSFGVEQDVEHIIVRVEGEGVTGWGECVASNGPWYSYETNLTAWHILSDFLIPLVLATEPQAPQDLAALFARVRGHNMAKAALEAAIWDAFARWRKNSLAHLFGGTRDRVSVGVSVGLQATPDALVKRVGGYLAEGYARIKIKIKPGHDLEFVRALRATFPRIKLQVDANSAYTLKDIAMLKALDEFDLVLIEQPLGYDDLYQHSLLQRELRTPLCLDESINSPEDALASMSLGACRIINIKPGRVGGFSAAICIHDDCQARGVPVWCGGMLETGIGRAGNVALAAMPNFSLPADLSASKRYYQMDLVEPEFEIESDSTMRVPNGGGIGVRVVEDRVESVTIQRAEFLRQPVGRGGREGVMRAGG